MRQSHAPRCFGSHRRRAFRFRSLQVGPEQNIRLSKKQIWAVVNDGAEATLVKILLPRCCNFFRVRLLRCANPIGEDAVKSFTRCAEPLFGEESRQAHQLLLRSARSRGSIRCRRFQSLESHVTSDGEAPGWNVVRTSADEPRSSSLRIHH